MTKDCEKCVYKDVDEKLLPCRECYNSFCGIPFDKPSKYEPVSEYADGD